jgi:hypothetical protein
MGGRIYHLAVSCMLITGQCDSRQYRFAYEIKSAVDVPGDFPVPFPISLCCSVIFMPGDTQDVWQEPCYPPRIYILTRDTLAVYPHPTADETPFVISLDDLIEIDSETALLYGAFQLYGNTISRCFRYSATHHKHVAAFLRKVRSLWLPSFRMKTSAGALPSRDRPVDFRCQCAAEAELDTGEAIYKYCLQPQREKKIERWIFSKIQVSPAIFLILTNRRIMTISTSKCATSDQYGIELCYTAPCNLSAAIVEQTVDGFNLHFEIKNDRTWKLSLADEQMPFIAAILTLLKL